MPLKYTEIVEIFPVSGFIFRKYYIRLLRSVVKMGLAVIRSSFGDVPFRRDNWRATATFLLPFAEDI